MIQRTYRLLKTSYERAPLPLRRLLATFRTDGLQAVRMARPYVCAGDWIPYLARILFVCRRLNLADCSNLPSSRFRSMILSAVWFSA